MPDTTIAITLPDSILARLRHAARDLQQPVETVLLQSISGNLPPDLRMLPAEYQTDLASMQILDDQTLWVIVRRPRAQRPWLRHQELLEKQQSTPLSDTEAVELAQLQAAVDRDVLRRSFALALLKWRGHAIPQYPVAD